MLANVLAYTNKVDKPSIHASWYSDKLFTSASNIMIGNLELHIHTRTCTRTRTHTDLDVNKTNVKVCLQCSKLWLGCLQHFTQAYSEF